MEPPLSELPTLASGMATLVALRYIHAVEGRDLEIAKALSDLALDDNAAKLPRSH